MIKRVSDNPVNTAHTHTYFERIIVTILTGAYAHMGRTKYKPPRARANLL